MILSPDGDTDNFDIVAGIFQGDIYTISIHNLWTRIEKSQKKKVWHKKARSRYNPAETIIAADYVDDLAFLDSTSAQVKSLLYSLVQAAKGIGLYVNSDKTEFMCFNENGDISSLDDKPNSWGILLYRFVTSNVAMNVMRSIFSGIEVKKSMLPLV